jgi:endoglucanase
MKRFAAFASLFLLAASLSVAETPVERYGWLAVDGNRLISKNTGKPVQLRGMSLFWSIAGPTEGCGFYNSEVVNTLANDWKANVVRAAMGVDEKWGTNDNLGYRVGNKTCGGKPNDALVDTVVKAAINNGIYAIIDYHTHVAHKYPDVAKEFFQNMANKYKNYPNVLYEIYNEPRPSDGGNWTAVKSYAETIIDAIRAIDTTNVIIVGTPMWCQDVDVATANPITGEKRNNLVYSLHFYSSTHKDTLRMKAEKAMNINGKALFVSESGITNAQANPPEDTVETNRWLTFLDTNKVSWVNWSISTKERNDTGPEKTSALVKNASTTGGWTTDKLTVSGNYIRNKLREAAQREESSTALAAERAVPNTQQPSGSATIAPVAAQPNKFSAGPVPTNMTSGGVKFFWQGKPVTGGSLFIYDAVGNSVKSVGINATFASDSSKRTIGSWDLTDAKGRRVTAGSYLVRGKVVTQNGVTVNVSSILVVSNQ